MEFSSPRENIFPLRRQIKEAAVFLTVIFLLSIVFLFPVRATPTVTVTLNDTTPVAAGNVTFTLDFSENMNQSQNATVQIFNTSIYNITAIGSLGWQSATQWTGWYNFTKGTGDGNYTINVTAAQNASGTVMAQNIANTFLLDTISPNSTASSPAQNSYRNLSLIDITFALTETNINTTNCSITNSTGSIVNSTVNTSTGTVHCYLSVYVNDAYNITLTHYDLAGNQNSTTIENVTLDRINPQVSITTPATNATLTSRTIDVTLTVTESNINLTNCTIKNSTGSILNSTTNTSTGTVHCYMKIYQDTNINITATTYDLAGNQNATTNSNITVEATKPTATLTLNDTSPVAVGNVTFTLDFSEAMNQTINTTVKIKNSSTYNITEIGWTNSTRWTGWYNFTTGTGDGNYTVNITAAKDLVGNTMDQDITNTFILDTTNPAVTINSPASDTNLTSKVITINLTVTEVNLNYTNISIVYTNGTVANSTTNSTTGEYLINLSVSADGTYNITATSYDLVGRSASALNTNITIDSTAPTVTLTLSDPSPTKIGNVTFTLDFSEAMKQTVNATVQLINHTIIYNVTAIGWTNSTRWTGWYNFTTSDAEGNYTVNLTAAKDLEGNTMSQDTSNILIFDRTAPTVTLTLSDPTPTKAGNVTFTLDFSEAMDQTVNATVKVKNTSTYNVTAIGWTNSTRWRGNYVFTTGTGDGNYTVNITAAKDLAGNTMTQNIANTFLLDTASPYEVNLTLNATVVRVNESINVSCAASDVTDTNVTVSDTGANTSLAGVWRVNCTATDDAGNTNTTSVAYVVIGDTYALLGENVTVNSSKTDLIVPQNNNNSAMVVPSNITNATINLGGLIDEVDSVNTATINGSINISANTSEGVIEVTIPANVTINGSSDWTGVINLPEIVAGSSVTVTADSGKTATVSEVVEIGYGNVSIVFSNAVRILIPGEGGKDAGYYRNGTFTKITATCANDSQAAGDALDAGSDCKIDSGSDLVIWTKHFTSFVTYTQTAIPPGSSHRYSSGGSAVSTLFWSETRIVNDTDFVNGYTASLQYKQRFKFKIGSQDHYAGIVNLTSTKAIINISSETQQITLNVGEDAKIDVDGEGYYDLYIKLNSITNNTASITLKSIFEKMTTSPATNPQTQTPQEQPPSGETPPVTTPKTECGTEGIRRCHGNDVEECKNGKWMVMEICSAGCDASKAGCMSLNETQPSPTSGVLGKVLLMIFLLLLLAGALIYIKRPKKDEHSHKLFKEEGHGHTLHIKANALEERMGLLEKGGKNVGPKRITLQDIRQDISSGLHYVADVRLSALAKELDLLEFS